LLAERRIGGLKKTYFFFCYRVPKWGISIHADFGPMGCELSSCGGRWLG